MVKWQDGEEVQEEGHFIVKEHVNDRNGKWVPEERDVRIFDYSSYVYGADFKLYEWSS